MRVLHLNHLGHLGGGAEGYIADVGMALEDLGHSSHLIYFSQDSGQAPMAKATHVPLPDWPRPLGQALWALEREIEKLQPDVVYLHSVYHPEVVRWAAAKLPTAAYLHGPYVVCPGSMKYLLRQQRICTRAPGLACLLYAQISRCCWGKNPLKHLHLVRRVRAFIEAYHQIGPIFVGSRFLRDLLVQEGLQAHRVSVLHPVLFREAPPYSPPPHPDRVLFAGRLVPEKGLRLLIQALSRVESGWELIVAGEGEDGEACRNLARELGVADRVHFAGWLGEETMARAISESAIVTVPSLWPEPFGRVGPEAFLHGRPVVAFSVGGISDWLEHEVTGLLVPPGDVEGLSAALERLLVSTDLQSTLGNQGRTRAVSTWTAQSHIERLVSAFERIAGCTAGLQRVVIGSAGFRLNTPKASP